MRNSVLETDRQTDGRTDRTQVQVLSCASQLKICTILYDYQPVFLWRVLREGIVPNKSEQVLLIEFLG